MAQVPFIDLAFLVKEAGFPAGETTVTMIALAVPESGRNPTAQGINYKKDANGNFVLDAAGNKIISSYDWGLWQINSTHCAAGGLLPGWTKERLFIPEENAKAAFIVWRAQGLSAWAAYNNSLHTPSMDAAKVANDARSRITINLSQITSLQGQLEIANTSLTACQADKVKFEADNAALVASNAALQAAKDALAQKVDAVKVAVC